MIRSCCRLRGTRGHGPTLWLAAGHRADSPIRVTTVKRVGTIRDRLRSETDGLGAGKPIGSEEVAAIHANHPMTDDVPFRMIALGWGES